MNKLLKPAPSGLSENAFVETYGGVYEHSPWIAHQVFLDGLTAKHDSAEELSITMAAIVDASDQEKRLDLICAHPDLAGKAAVNGELTAESTTEQSSAGIDQCCAEEFALFIRLNTDYQSKFGFPFIMAVRGSNRHLILSAFKNRIQNDYETEFNCAISEIHKIARLRLETLSE